LIQTEEQRRWWFATHPEFSWSRGGIRTGGKGWQSSFGHPADKNENQIDSIAHELELLRQAKEQDQMGLEADPHTALDLMPYRRFVTSPLQALEDLFRNSLKDAVLSAVKRGESQGPGEWVEKARSPIGLEHQSKMSGQSIRESSGKLYIKEYRLNDVHFDDYKDGKLYEYKGSQGNLLNKNGEFHDWYSGVERDRKQAWSQVEAAGGMPVIWRVGADQVKAFEKTVGDIPGIIVVP
jgi:hypothetical protein